MNIGMEGDFTNQDLLKTLDSLVKRGKRRVSVSVIQRLMRFHFNKSANILEELVTAGLILKTVDDKTTYLLNPRYLSNQ